MPDDFNWKDWCGFLTVNSINTYRVEYISTYSPQSYGFPMMRLADRGPTKFRPPVTIVADVIKSTEFKYTEDEMILRIFQLVNSYPERDFSNFMSSKSVAKRFVADRCLRGEANVNWRNIWGYVGDSQVDRPFIVFAAPLEDGVVRYGIYKIPEYSLYGVKLK